MGKFIFEGDVSGVSDRQLDYVGEVLEKQGFSNEKVLFSGVGKADDNFIANVKRVTVEKDGKTTKMIAKVAPGGEMIRAMMRPDLVFQNEDLMYTEVLPKFTSLEEDAGIPESERLNYAECYGSLMEMPSEIILLEDLQVSNYVMLDKFKSLTNETVKMILKEFGKYHAASFALKHQEPAKFKDFAAKLVNTIENMSHQQGFDTYFIKLESDMSALLEEDTHKGHLKGALTSLILNMRENIKVDVGSQYSVIQQGDPWTNNIMFVVENENPIKCCMIDYQMSKENSPAADVTYMIFNCTDYETRAKHYHDWIEYYHDQLEISLANFGLQAKIVYPRDRLDADLKRLGKLSFGISLMVVSMLMRDAAEAANFKNAMNSTGEIDDILKTVELGKTQASTLARVRSRLEGLIASYVELGYI